MQTLNISMIHTNQGSSPKPSKAAKKKAIHDLKVETNYIVPGKQSQPSLNPDLSGDPWNPGNPYGMEQVNRVKRKSQLPAIVGTEKKLKRMSMMTFENVLSKNALRNS